MNCIFLNNEFNLKEFLVIKYYGKIKKKRKEEVLLNKRFYFGYFMMVIVFRFGKVRSNYKVN